jgi:hypothetical protein
MFAGYVNTKEVSLICRKIACIESGLLEFRYLKKLEHVFQVGQAL